MRCPIDGADLEAVIRSGIEIDFCPRCKGVWLDRGELDKLIEREADSYTDFDADPTAITGKRKNDEPPISLGDSRAPRRQRYADDDDYDDRPQKRRRGSFLEDIFDIFD